MVFSCTESGAKLPLVILSCPPGTEQAPGYGWWLLLLLGVGIPNKVFEVRSFFPDMQYAWLSDPRRILDQKAAVAMHRDHSAICSELGFKTKQK